MSERVRDEGALLDGAARCSPLPSSSPRRRYLQEAGVMGKKTRNAGAAEHQPIYAVSVHEALHHCVCGEGRERGGRETMTLDGMTQDAIQDGSIIIIITN